MSEGLAALRAYVTAGDEERYTNLPQGFLRVDVTHSNLQQRWHDVLVFGGTTIGELKHQLFKKNGTLIDSMELFLRDGSRGGTIFMSDDSKTLEYYGGTNGCEIHIRDTDPFSISANGALENVDLVPKYVMPDEVYDKLPNTLRAHIREQRQKDPNFKLKAATDKPRPIYTPDEHPPTPTNATSLYYLGQRCEVQPGGRRGVIKYYGSMAGLQGNWIGVDLDEPLGHNDGTGIDGVRYFESKGENYGCFSKHYNVEVGDQFVERDPFASSSEDEI